MCKLSHIGSDILISECWHLNLLSAAPLQQNDYFFIISLIFHHYCTSLLRPPNLLLPTALLKSNYTTDAYHLPLMKLSMCQGSFLDISCYINTESQQLHLSFLSEPPSFEFCGLFRGFFCFVLPPVSPPRADILSLALCCNLRGLRGSVSLRIMMMILPRRGKYEDASVCK